MSKLEEREQKAATARRKSFVQAAISNPATGVEEIVSSKVESKQETPKLESMSDDKKERSVAAMRAKKRVVVRKVKETGVDEKMKQYSFYLPLNLQKAIVIKTAEGELDKSGVIREALRMYLADILSKME
jgi:hypothetical protein